MHIEQFTGQLAAAERAIAAALPNIDELPIERLDSILARYNQAIQPVFIPWLLNAWMRCSSPEAIKACRDNLLCEISEDHPRMLEAFTRESTNRTKSTSAESAGTAAFIRHRYVLEQYIKVSPEAPLMVLTILENTSRVFIPWLAAAGKKVGVTDFQYTDIHGEADIEHAASFLEALRAETNLLDSHSVPDVVLMQCRDFIISIFAE